MVNKYSNVVSKLLAGDTLFLQLDDGKTKESIRTALAKEKKRQEDMLRNFELPVQNTRLKFEHQINGTYKVFLKPLDLGFQILEDVPPPPSENEGTSE